MTETMNMKKTRCNPVDIEYRFAVEGRRGTIEPFREGADPGAVFWNGKYYLVTSKGAAVHYSTDLVNWTPVHDYILPHDCYGPDLFVHKGRLHYVTDGGNFIYRAIDPDHGKWEKTGSEIGVKHDPTVFCDDDGRIYFYHGCTAVDPLYGAEIDPDTFLPVTDWIPFTGLDGDKRGWERCGDDNLYNRSAIRRVINAFFQSPPQDERPAGHDPWPEGAFVIKHNGKYYLQRSIGGTEYNTYAEDVWVGDHPLGPFTLQADAPTSHKAGGFITGAGHSCSFQDQYGNWVHASTMRISQRFIFERRIGFFPINFLEDGTYVCQQRFGDYPHYIPDTRTDEDLFTGWMLQSFRAPVIASSEMEDCPAYNAVDENIMTHWVAAENDPLPTLTVDLQTRTAVKAVQVNFSEHHCRQWAFRGPGGAYRYLLEGSDDGENWQTIADEQKNTEDKTHRYHECNCSARYIRLTVTSVPAGGMAAVSGLRVFGSNGSAAPAAPVNVTAIRNKLDPTQVMIRWQAPADCTGINIRWGLTPDRMYHCRQIDGAEHDHFLLACLHSEMDYCLALEAYGRGGVSPLTEYIEIKN